MYTFFKKVGILEIKSQYKYSKINNYITYYLLPIGGTLYLLLVIHLMNCELKLQSALKFKFKKWNVESIQKSYLKLILVQV